MKHPIYLDNAATTALSSEALEAMMPYLTESFGNPSSIYSIGRSTRVAIEMARKTVARALGVKPMSIFFTSCGTESNNTAILSAIRDLGCTSIITSPIEHHAVLHTANHYSRQYSLPLDMVALDEDGVVDYADLEHRLRQHQADGRKPLVSLMYANNEIGSLLDIQRVSQLCRVYGAIFHSDCVQAVAHYPIDLSGHPVHFISASGHKFHGPKGVGILYVNPSLEIAPLIHGGSQERNMRAGTENVYGIIGFAKALELAMEGYEADSRYIGGLRSRMRELLVRYVPGVRFNGTENGLYTVLSVCFPRSSRSESLLTEMDQAGICVSGGSACTSGEAGGSHVIRALANRDGCTTVRFSFSKYNTAEEIEYTVNFLRSVLSPEKAGVGA
ncbi:MAG: cysteine desulfurase [Bacteroidetes bacterium]|nr:cysteine desulfurase [Bacteroidota bacterium]